MCRLVAYLGEQVVLDEVLFQPDSSIVEQAVHPQLLSAMNLAGFGVVAWDDESPSADLPWTYRTAGLPFFDRNLRALSRKARATATLAHVRGVLLSDREVVNEQNVHPFRYEGIPIALAMNGDLDRFPEMRADMADLVAPELAKQVEGTTDTEWLYALILSHLSNPHAPAADPEELAGAVEKALRQVREVRERRGLGPSIRGQPRGLRRPLPGRDALRVRLRLVPRGLDLRGRGAPLRLHNALVRGRLRIRTARRGVERWPR